MTLCTSALQKVSGHIVDVAARRIYPGCLHLSQSRITAIEPLAADAVDAGFLLPGFVDAHLHVESSLLSPPEFARLAVQHGTVAALCDPHEIANVLGVAGVRYMLAQAARVPFHFCFGVPSCVPATHFETAGATLGCSEVAELLADPRITHLAEVMNYPGVLSGDVDLLAKLSAARKLGRPIDGHAPGLSGDSLARYVRSGMGTDHECTTLKEAQEKLQLGQKILIREGSAAKNFDALWPLLGEHSAACMLCCDDLHPDDLLAGHINRLVQRAIASGVDLFAVLQAACVNPVRHYRLPVGLLAAGDSADYIRVRDLTSFAVEETCIAGQLVFQGGRFLIPALPVPICNRFAAAPIAAESLKVPVRPGVLRCIVAHDRQLVTESRLVAPTIRRGLVEADPHRDVLKLAVKSRYSDAPPQVAFVHGFGLRSGALASSVAHDSHNVIAVGADDEALLRTINLVLAAQGGLAAVTPDRELLLPLPIAGLMSDQDGARVAATYSELNRLAASQGCMLTAPLMTLSFLALLVIPSLKLSDRGLFDSARFQFVDLFAPVEQVLV